MQKIREEKDETPTIYSRACGFVETVDDYIGLGCLDRRKKEMRAGSGCLSQVPHTIGLTILRHIYSCRFVSGLCDIFLLLRSHHPQSEA